jgi:hypothetical protein
MLKAKTKLDGLLETYKDLDHVYIKKKLEEYDDLVKYYSILCTKQQMEDSNARMYEWWKLVEAQFKEEMQKNLVAHRRDEERYNFFCLLSKKPFQILCAKL